MIKKITKFGTPIVTNMPEPLHNLVVNFIEKLEDYYLEASDGDFSLQDICKVDPEQLEWISEVFTFNVSDHKEGYTKTY